MDGMIKLKSIKSMYAEDFDRQVNAYLAEGWAIRKLTAAGTERYSVLIAFLTKDEDA